MMKNDKLKKYNVFNSNSNDDINIDQVKSEPALNHEFWHCLKESINMNKDSPLVKGRILIAKRILTPIIQDLMTDALEQIEAEKIEKNKISDEKKINVLYNNIKTEDIWCLEDAKDSESDKGEEWAMKILREISEDLEQPFEKLTDKVAENLPKDQSTREDRLNETLLAKLVAIHHHLGGIIDRLKKRCGNKCEETHVQKSVNTDVDLSQFMMERNQMNESIVDSVDLGYEPKRNRIEQAHYRRDYRNCREHMWRTFCASIQQDTGFQHSNLDRNTLAPSDSSARPADNRDKPIGRAYSQSSIIHLPNTAKNEKQPTIQKCKSTYSFSQHVLFEEKRNQTGNKEIVIKCLEDLEKVRTYLEALRNNEECEKPKFSGLETCENENCIESQPHLHSNLPDTPMVLKLNKHAEESELDNDLIIGIPGLTKSSPDVHILLNRKEQNSDSQPVKEKIQPVTQQKRVLKESRIPKLINKKRVNINDTKKNNAMRITLGTKENSSQKALNLVIFDPDDPSRSIIKMKEQNKPKPTGQSPLVSKNLLNLVKKEKCCSSFSSNCNNARTSLRNPFWPRISIYCNNNREDLKASSSNDWNSIMAIFFNMLLQMNMHLGHRSIQKIFFSIRSASNSFKNHPHDEFKVQFSVHISPYSLTLEILADIRHFKTLLKKLFSYHYRSIVISTMKPQRNCHKGLPLEYIDPKKLNDDYMKRLFDFMSVMKGSRKVFIKTPQPVSKFVSKEVNCTQQTSFYLNLTALDTIQPNNYTYQVYFFGCFGGRKEKHKSNPNVRNAWNCQSKNIAVYPIWTIKKSKYYDVPRSKKTEKIFVEKLSEDSIEKAALLKSPNESHTEVHMQVSEVSVCRNDIQESKLEKIESDKVNIKTEVKRKVSFRDEVDFSSSGVDFQEPVESQHENYDKQYWSDMGGKEIQASSSDLKYIQKLSEKISDLIMTDSLMQIADDLSKHKMKLKQPLRNNPSKNLDLTDSAKNILARLSKSFDDGDKESFHVLETVDGRLVSQFYDERGEPITEVFNQDGDLIGRIRANDVENLASILFDNDGSFVKNRYDIDGQRIRAVYDANGRSIKGIVSPKKEAKKKIQADFDIVQYYDYNGKPIRHLYNSSGHEIKTVGKDFTSTIFGDDGNLQVNLFTRKGKRISAVYDSRGQILGKLSSAQLDSKLNEEPSKVSTVEDEDSISKLFKSNQQVTNVKEGIVSDRILNSTYKKKQSNVKLSRDHSNSKEELSTSSLKKEAPQLDEVEDDDSISKLFKTNSKEENTIRTTGSIISPVASKKFFDQEGNLLIGVYDKKGKPLKVTSSGEADELVPYLFDKKGRFQSKRYDSKGRELKAVFGEDGTAISEVSIPWLNALLAGTTIPKTKPKQSFFRKKSKTKTKLDKSSTLDKLYDADGRVITVVYDSKGLPLIKSESGNASKLIPYLFDDSGRFLKKMYTTKRKKLRSVHDKLGNVLSTISLSLVNGSKSARESDIKVEHNKELGHQLKYDESKSHEKGPDQKPGSTPNITKSSEHQDVGKEKQRIFDKKGNIITGIYDSKGNSLATSNSGDALKLLPHLCDNKGRFLRNRFDCNGKQLKFVYDKDGNVMNQMAMSMTEQVEESNAYKAYENEVMDEHDTTKNNGAIDDSRETDERENKLNHSVSGNGTTVPSNSETSQRIRSEVVGEEPQISQYVDERSPYAKAKERNSQKEKAENKQPRPTSLISTRKDIDLNPEMPEKIMPKAGDSIHKFYDAQGSVITEVYDAKGKAVKKTKSGEVDVLAPFLFDEEGIPNREVYDRKGNKLNNIYDEKGRIISRISIPSLPSEDEMQTTQTNTEKKLPGSVYDKYGNLVKEIYDSKGHPVVITRLAKMADLAPIIFDAKGVRRKVYDKQGCEIGPIFDHRGNVLKHPPTVKKSKLKLGNERSQIFSKAGRPLRNFYNSEGTLIIALYNDHGKALCNVEKDQNNIEVLSKFFFDKYGHFLRGRFFDYRGARIKHIYDSDDNIIRAIRRTHSRKIAHHYNTRGEVKTKKIISSPKQRAYYGRSEVRPVENITRNLTSQSDTILESRRPILDENQDEVVSNTSSSLPAITSMTIKKFYDKHGQLLTGVYNSRKRVLGYSASGNARVLAPYLFDANGNFITGRYNIEGKPLKHLYDAGGNLVKKISKPSLRQAKEAALLMGVTKERKKRKFYDDAGKVITSIYDSDGKKIFGTTKSRCGDLTEHLFDEDGNLLGDLYNSKGKKIREVYDKHQKVIRRISPMSIDTGGNENKEKVDIEIERQRFPILNNFKDKILTVIYDNQKSISDKISFDTIPKKMDRVLKKIMPNDGINKINETFKRIGRGSFAKVKDKRLKTTIIVQPKTFLYDENGRIIREICHEDGTRISKIFDSHQKLLSNLYSPSGNLIKDNVLNFMFEEDAVFCPKAYDSCGKIIKVIYANKKLLTKVYDKNRNPAKVDSEIIYLVSEKSLPAKSNTTLVETAPKQINYFSEGSTYPVPEGQQEKNQIKNQYELIQENEYYGDDQMVPLGDMSRQTEDGYACDHCQNVGSCRTNLEYFGEEIMDKLSRFTIPLEKFLPRAFFRKEADDAEAEELDSLEALINDIIEQRRRKPLKHPKEESYGSNQRVFLEGDDNIPISRKVVEKTLMGCVHLSSSTNVVGKISNSVLQHFTTLILQEIKQNFYKKLSALQWRDNYQEVPVVFECEADKGDVCIGTELKFDDSLIGKHSLVQTSAHFFGKDEAEMCASCMNYTNQTLEGMESFEEPLDMGCVNHRAFVCKVPNLQPFVIMMNKKEQNTENNEEEKKETSLQVPTSADSDS